MITPIQSQAVGVLASLVLLLLILGAELWYASTYSFWVAGLVGGILLGGFLAYENWSLGQHDIEDLNMIGVGLLLGYFTRLRFTTGKHWLPFGIMSMTLVPDPETMHTVAMPGEVMLAQDRGSVLVGIGAEGESCGIMASISDAIRYIRNPTWEPMMRKSYLASVRLLVNLARNSISIVNEQSIIAEYLMLPTFSSHQSEKEATEVRLAHAAFAEHLRSLTTVSSINGGQESQETQRLYSEDAVKAILSRAGRFRADVLRTGIAVWQVLMPNLRLAPEEEAAAIRKAVAAEDAVALQTVMNKLAAVTRDYRQANPDVSPDLAGLIAAGAAKQSGISIEHKTYSIPGVEKISAGLAALRKGN